MRGLLWHRNCHNATEKAEKKNNSLALTLLVSGTFGKQIPPPITKFSMENTDLLFGPNYETHMNTRYIRIVKNNDRK